MFLDLTVKIHVLARLLFHSSAYDPGSYWVTFPQIKSQSKISKKLQTFSYLKRRRQGKLLS